MNLKIVFAVLFAAVTTVQGQDPIPAKESRAKAEKLRGQGNWKDALNLHRELLEKHDDSQSGKDLKDAVNELQRLNLGEGLDELVESAVNAHGENWGLLQEASSAYWHVQHWGYILDGEFKRGHHRGGGRYVSSMGRDRVRAIQLILEAIEKAEGVATAQKRGELNSSLANLVQMGRTGMRQVWALGVLTPLDVLPDYGEDSSLSSGSGAPVDDEGNALVISIPESWEAARNDGERWRWAITETARVDPGRKSEVESQWANFLVQHFGVRTLSGYGWWRQSDPSEAEGILQVHTLKETETIASLASGVKRFELPKDYQFIPLLRKISGAGKGGSRASAGDLLVQVLLDRRQFGQAVTELSRVITTHGNGHEQHRLKLLHQIQRDWGRFEYAPMFQAGEKALVNYVYRNAEEATLSLHALKINLVVADIFKHLESNPRTVDHKTINIGAIGQRLVQDNQKKYLGAKVKDWKVALKPRDGHWDTRAQFEMPTTGAGAYLLEARAGKGNTSWIVVWISDTALISQQLKEGKLFYLSESKAGAPLSGELELFGYQVIARKGAKRVLKKYDVKTKRFKKKIGADGVLILGKDSLASDHQWMAVARGVDGRRALLGFQYHRWRDFRWDKFDSARSYGLTDRPVYRPEQKVHLKFWARAARYDLGDVSLYAGKACTLEIHHQTEGKVHEAKNLRTDEFGGVELEYELPADARLGQYYVHLKGEVPGGTIQFRVEEYKKPEFEVKVEAPSTPVSLGEVILAKVVAKYYHGAPVTEAKVKVKVQRYSHTQSWFPGGRWDWLYGKGYWWFSGDYEWYPGWRRWGCRAPVPVWWNQNRGTPPELVLEREFEIGADGTVEISIDTSLAKLVHGDMDHRYEISAEVVDSSRRAIYGKGSVLAARRPFGATIWLDRGFARPGGTVNASFAAKTLDGRAVKVTGSADLFRVTLDVEGKVKEEKVQSFELKPAENGEGELRFKAPATGQYRLSISLTDEKGNKEEGASVFVVRRVDDDGSGSRFNPLELVLDKKDYKSGEEAKLLVNTNKEGSTVLLFLRSNGRSAEELRTITIEGKSKEVVIKLRKGDMPNIFVQAVTLSDGEVVTQTMQIVLPPEKRLLSVEVEPGKSKYKPREKGILKLRLKDENGEPYQGTTVVTVYDKSLEYISGGSNVGNIREFFWSWKRSFSNDGLVHSQNWSGRNLNKLRAIAMQTLGRFGGNLAEFGWAAGAAGGADGMLRNNLSMPMASASPRRKGLGDSKRGAALKADAEMAPAEGLGQGGPEVLVRSEFADLVKWAGSVTTNERGEAEIEVEYPDNLTTWKVKVWALGHGTRVGEGSAEVITSKDLIVRLQAPRFFIESDQVVLSAVVHNYHEEAKEVNVSLELEGGTLVAQGAQSARIAIPAGGEKRVDWLAIAKAEGEVTVRMKAIASDDADAMEMTFPVYVHGMSRTESWSRAIRPKGKRAVIEFEVPEKRRPEQTRLEIRYSPTVAGAVVDALPYLVNYPYGCTEQTLNRFVPTVITQRLLQDMNVNLQEVKNKRVNLNPQEIGDAKQRAEQWKRWQENPVWDKDEVDKMVRKGIKRLREMQNDDGGWGWFSAYGERSYPHTTAVVVHGLTVAKLNGAKIPADILKQGVVWLKISEGREAERIRMWEKRKKNTKRRADAQDALVRRVLGEAGVDHAEMLGFLFRDKVGLPVYAKCLLGLELHRTKDNKKRNAVITNIEQFLKIDDENQTAWLELGNGGYWWYWYGSEFEAHAWYLKLLSVAKPKSPQASGLVKYLVNNRKHATYWRSTRDTAYCIEAIADYLRASEEDSPDMEVEVVLDGKVLKTVKITKENLFSFDGTAVVAGDVLSTGKHKVELRKRGSGPLYANVYLTVFSKEDFLKKAGLEVKVERTFYKLVPVKALQDVAGSKGQALKQRKEKYERLKLAVGDTVESGDLIEVELSVESKNDYSYLLFEDWKAAGLEAVEVQSGQSYGGGLGAFVEFRDEKVALFVRSLPRGRHNLSYRLRAEIPGTFSALPTRAVGMYAPELRGNSDEMKITVRDR
jgi:uncharacterized protein YfaS (alpha-2-macroglobulin family)